MRISSHLIFAAASIGAAVALQPWSTGAQPPATPTASASTTSTASPFPPKAAANQPAVGASPGPPVPGGKSVFHKRAAIASDDGNNGGTSVPAGMSAPASLGPPPQQSQAGAFGGTRSTKNQDGRIAERIETGFGSASEQVNANGALPRSGSTDLSDGNSVAQQLTQGFSDPDPSFLISLYSSMVDYYDSGQISKDAVLAQVQEYFARWPVRRWEVVPPVKAEPMGGSIQKVTFTARYDLSNPANNRRVTGVARETVIVAPDTTGAVKIISHHEKTNGTNSSRRKYRGRGSRDKVYDAQPAFSLPPGIPWPTKIRP